MSSGSPAPAAPAASASPSAPAVGSPLESPQPAAGTAERRYTVAVRALCEFTAKSGDLDFRFTPSPTAQEGTAGHAWVTSGRPAHYQREVTLRADHGLLHVRGRADGYDPQANRLEEIKTFRGRLDAMPANHRALHWAQLKIYGAMLCRERGLAQVELALVYFDLGEQRETVLAEWHGAAELEQYFVEHCGRFLDWARRELDHRTARDEALTALAFPHGDFHAGQRQLSRAVFSGARQSRPLMAQAPTGIGKTIATLYAQLKVAPRERLDKLFFLTAKTSGRAPALQALQSLYSARAALPLRTLEFASKEAACEYPGRICNGAACPLARGFYDRLPAARAAALEQGALTQPEVRRIALGHQVCPYYLSQELTRWSDVVVGDYNHYFDASALLFALTLANDWRVGVLVDEAHNLLERGRQMYSVELTPALFQAARSAAPRSLQAALRRVETAWSALSAAQGEPYQPHEGVPESLDVALRAAVSALTEHFAHATGDPDANLQRLYFDALYFCRLAESIGPHSVFDVTLCEPPAGSALDAVLTLRNVIPAPYLKPRFTAARACVLFSATLTPHTFYRDTLGLPPDCDFLDVDSPFDATQLEVRIEARISTRYRDRAASLAPIADLIAHQYGAAPGNYLAFFSSFEYLQSALRLLQRRHPRIPVWEQLPRMPPQDRREFLSRFTTDSRGVGFAVLGGAFSEGIDLPRERLIGAFIATLGLPPVNPVNAEIARRMQQSFGAAYEYTYLFPGLQKVVQAAGRVIRTPQDRGVVHLIDDRFRRPEVLALLPRWWAVQPRDYPEAPSPNSPDALWM